jgi:hypothetical protein
VGGVQAQLVLLMTQLERLMTQLVLLVEANTQLVVANTQLIVGCRISSSWGVSCRRPPQTSMAPRHRVPRHRVPRHQGCGMPSSTADIHGARAARVSS